MATVRYSQNCCRASVRIRYSLCPRHFSFSFVLRLKTWTRQEGAVRLSEDDGPPAHSFLDQVDDDDDNYEDDGDGDGNRGEDALHPSPVELQRVGITRVEVTSLEDAPPVPPPKGQI